MAADPGYDDKKLYEYSKKILGIDSGLSSVERYENTPKKRLESCMLLSIGIGTVYLQSERNIYRAIDRTYQISV